MQSANCHAPIWCEIDVVLVKQRFHMLRLQTHKHANTRTRTRTHTHTHAGARAHAHTHRGRWRSDVAKDPLDTLRLRSGDEQANDGAYGSCSSRQAGEADREPCKGEHAYLRDDVLPRIAW